MQGAAGDRGSAARAAHHWHAMPVTRSVGCLGGDERRDRIPGREGLVQRLVLVVAYVLLAALAELGGYGRTVAVVHGREILSIEVVAPCGAPVLACTILEPRTCPGACCTPLHSSVEISVGNAL